MFAQIIPLVRLPRRFAHFDYQIPTAMGVQVGDLVEIKFKNRLLSGIVRELSDKSEFKKISLIESIIQKNYLQDSDVKRLELIAHNLIQSPSTVFLTALNGS
ncbi:hypothetical protein KJ673_00665, partial [Patescibacteria group bacterium]|nr:hypothetical protein [Patescibacteria group bacterium]